ALSEPGVAFGIDETDARRNVRIPPARKCQTPIERGFGRGLCNHDSASTAHHPPGRTHFAASEWKTMPAWLTPLRETVGKWSEHKDARLGAALAYYSVFSLGPLILIAIAIAGLVFGAEAVQGQVLGTLKGLVGDTGTQAIEAMLKGADRPREGMVATVIGIGTLVFAATGVVVQLKDALNTVWEVEATAGSGVWRFVRSYILSLAGVLALGFLLLTSMLLTAALAAAGKYVAAYLPEATLQVAGFVASFAVISLLFAMMFKWLPDTKVEWRDVWL